MVVFGPPGCGVSTILEVISEASETPNLIVPYAGPESIPLIEEAMQHAEVVFVDVEGGFFGPMDLQALVDAGVLAAGGIGCIARIYASDHAIIERNAHRPDYITSEDLREWSLEASKLDEPARLHTVSYVMVPNHDLEEAARVVALRANLTR
jgi:hypothetical protein